MARIRTIKPEFFLDERIDEKLSYQERLLWIGLWCLADREGRLEDRPKYIKCQVFPYDSVNVDALLQKLSEHGYILRYVATKEYIQIKNFLKYQRPYHKEPPSEIPLPVIAASSSGHDREKNAGLGNGLGNGLDGTEKMERRLTAPSITLDLTLSTFKNITAEKLSLWRAAYPRVNLEQEIKKAAAWAIEKKQLKKNWGQFLVNWFARAYPSEPEPPKRTGPPTIPPEVEV